MRDYELIKLSEDVIKLLKIIIGVQALIFFAWIAQLVANLTIIVQLPMIKRYQKRIFQKLYDFKPENQINKEIEDIANEQEEEYIRKRNEKIIENLEEIEKSYHSIEFNKQTIEYIILTILIIIIIVMIFLKVQ